MTTTQHPEQVEVGEIWEYAADLCQDGNGGLVGERRTIVRDRSGGLWASGKEGGTSIDFLIAHARRVEPAKPACGAPDWCGFRVGDSTDPKRDIFLNKGNYPSHWNGHCSKACMQARVPPLESKPAETGKCERRIGSFGEQYFQKCNDNDGHAGGCSYMSSRNPGTESSRAAPPAQEAPKAPVCERGALLHGGPVLLRCVGKGRFRQLCDQCYLANEPVQKGPCGDVLHESDVPERLQRPKMAHSHGLEDPALEDA